MFLHRVLTPLESNLILIYDLIRKLDADRCLNEVFLMAFQQQRPGKIEKIGQSIMS